MRGGTLTGVTDMGPVSFVRPSVQTLETSPQPSAGTYTSGNAAQSGGVGGLPVAPQTAKAVAPAFGVSMQQAPAAKPVAVESYPLESAKARAEAAQRAYMMASLVAGLSPLNKPML